MKVEARLFLFLWVFFLIVTGIYLWASLAVYHAVEPTGPTVFILCFAMTLMIWFYLWVIGRKMNSRPEDNPKRWVKRAMAIIIAHCSSTWSRVNSLAGLVPNWNFMPRASYQARHSSRKAGGTLAISTSNADCDKLSSGIPMSTSDFCGKTPFIMPCLLYTSRCV